MLAKFVALLVALAHVARLLRGGAPSVVFVLKLRVHPPGGGGVVKFKLIWS